MKKRDSPKEISKGILVAWYYIINMYNMIRETENKNDFNITININKVLNFCYIHCGYICKGFLKAESTY